MQANNINKNDRSNKFNFIKAKNITKYQYQINRNNVLFRRQNNYDQTTINNYKNKQESMWRLQCHELLAWYMWICASLTCLIALYGMHIVLRPVAHNLVAVWPPQTFQVIV